MTRSAGTLALAEITISSKQRPNPPMPADSWGINIGAVTTFPEGLLVEVPPWGDDMDIGDSVNVRLNNQVMTSGFIGDNSQIGKSVPLFIESDRLTTGYFILDYTVTLPGTDPDPSPRTNIYIKLTRPGGRDMDPGTPGHSELHMVIPEDILLEGVDADTPFVPIEIKSPVAGMPAYPNIEEGDRIFLYWGSEKIEHVVTDEEANDPDNHVIVITVDKAVIDEEGDSEADGIPVAFYVLDVVNNRSEDWSATTYIDVDTGSPRLGAPLIKEADNNKLDIDDLPDPDTVTAQVIAVGSGFAVGDEIEMRLRGVTNDGEVVDKTYPLVQIDSINKVIDIPLPSIDVRLLVNTRAAFSYRLIKADGSDDRLSKSQFIEVIGEATQLAAPIAKDAIAGTLDPALPSTLIEIPWDESMTKGQVIDLKWLGTRGPQIYLPTLPPRLISDGEERDKESLYISVDGEHLRAIDGGTLELFYLLLRDTEAREVVSRQSLHADLLNIGEPVAELPPPVVEREQGGVLDPADVPNGTRLIVRQYTDQIRGDEVHYVWNGSRTGIKIDSAPVTEINENSDIPFSIHFDLVKNNEGGTVKASYWVTRVTGRISPSEILPMYIGTPMDLAAPSVKQATGVSPNQQLNPVSAQDDLTVVIPNYGIRPGDQVRVTWAGTAGEGSYVTPVQTLPTSREIDMPVEVIAYNLGRSVTVTYTVTPSGGSESPPSAPLDLAVLPLAQDDLLDARPKLLQAANGGEGTELDLSSLSADATCWVGTWPLIAPDQDVWLRLKGTKADGTVPYDLNIWAPPPWGPRTNPLWISQGFYEVPADYNYLKELKDGSTLTMEFKADLGKTTDEANATLFPLRTYTVSAVALVSPTITDILDSKGSVVGKTTVETSVTVTGTGSSGRQIQLRNAAANIGNPFTIPETGTTWSSILTGLAPDPYSIKARPLYGTGLPDSEAKTFTVIAAGEPTLDSVKAGDVEIPDGTTTVSLTLNLTGTAAKGQDVEIYDGSGAGAEPKGQATADPNTGIWTKDITVVVGDRRLYAKALYLADSIYSNVRLLTVVELLVPALIDIRDSKGSVVGGSTVESTVTVTGTGSRGQQIQLLDGEANIGNPFGVPTDSINWSTSLTGLTDNTYRIKAKALYGSGQESPTRSFTVQIEQPFSVGPRSISISGNGNYHVFLHPDYESIGQLQAHHIYQIPVTGGRPPYYFQVVASNPVRVANVNEYGQIYPGRSAGTATVRVSDSASNFADITVSITWVRQWEQAAWSVTKTQADSYVRQKGLTMPSRADLQGFYNAFSIYGANVCDVVHITNYGPGHPTCWFWEEAIHSNGKWWYRNLGNGSEDGIGLASMINSIGWRRSG